MRPVFVDTSALYALADRSDRRHDEAVAVSERLAKDKVPVFTTNYVVAEAHVLILSRLGHAAARTWLRNMKLRVEQVTLRDQQEARAVILRQNDKDYSLADATSFAVMKRLACRTAFTFDRHFQWFGFEIATDVYG